MKTFFGLSLERIQLIKISRVNDPYHVRGDQKDRITMSMALSNRALKRLQRQMEERINPRKNYWDKDDLTPFNVERVKNGKEIVYK